MLIEGWDVIDRAIRKHADLDAPLQTWTAATLTAAWRNIIEVRQTFPTADGVTLRSGKRAVTMTVFNIGGNNYRLITVMNYRAQVVSVLDVLTHAEYDKELWKRRFV